MLNDVPMEAKEAAMEYRAANNTIAHTQDWLHVNYPEVTRYSLNTFKAWCSSTEGKELYAAALEKVRKEARNRSFANKDSRLLAYIEVSAKILDKLRELEADDAKFSSLSRELRENFKCIKEEVDPFDINDGVTQSAFDRLIARTEGTPWEKILNQSLGLTRQTQGN